MELSEHGRAVGRMEAWESCGGPGGMEGERMVLKGTSLLQSSLLFDVYRDGV